jgi:uncharacterized membrane protein
VSPRSYELIDLVVRWVHVIAGIMWIGNSLLFNWLDRILEQPSKPGPGKQGETWLIHSGGFYLVEKTLLTGEPLPKPLHWFKWQAYTTWLSGAVLLVVVYYTSGRALMTGNESVLTPSTAVLVGIGSIVAAWVVYDVLWRFVFRVSRAAAALLSVLALLGLTWLLVDLLSGRAAFIHVGAALGTIMAGNVAMTIMPSQRVLVRSVQGGHGSDPVIADQAKTRSIHNNYLTFPVIVLMLSSHFPSVYGSPYSWLLMLVLIAGGGAVRHLMNVRFTWRPWRLALTVVIAAGILLLYGLVNAGVPRDPASGPVSFDQAHAIISHRCVSCHSAVPSDPTFGPAPSGVSFDSPDQVRAFAQRIRERAFVTRTMPPANKTGITDEERAALGAWGSSEPSR